MKAFRPVLVFLVLAAALPTFAADSVPQPAPTDLAAPLAGDLPTWLLAEPELGDLAMSTELAPGQGCSVQACNPRCLWCRTACDGFCLVFGGICQCA